MTKAQMKEKFSEINREVSIAYHENNLLEALQNLNAECGDGNKYCSADLCLMGILKHNNMHTLYADKALNLYHRYTVINARWDMLIEILHATDNFK